MTATSSSGFFYITKVDFGWDPNVPDSGVLASVCLKTTGQMFVYHNNKDAVAYNYTRSPGYLALPPGVIVLQVPGSGVFMTAWNPDTETWDDWVDPVFLYDGKIVQIDMKDLVEYKHRHHSPAHTQRQDP